MVPKPYFWSFKVVDLLIHYTTFDWLTISTFCLAFPSLFLLSVVSGWYAQSHWPAADGQAPGRVALGAHFPDKLIKKSGVKALSPYFRTWQETFLFLQEELSPVCLSCKDRQRKWHPITVVRIQPKTGKGCRRGEIICTLTVPSVVSESVNRLSVQCE